MSKYEVVRLFDIMKTCIFLIFLLDFSHCVLCLQYCNVSESDLYPLCPYKFLRRKRAPVDSYTRWGPLTKSSTEFIVKVLDEEETSSLTPRIPVLPGIIGVNYEPERQQVGKLIVGGAAVVPPRPIESLPKMTEESPVGPLDYTRFGVPSRSIPSDAPLGLIAGQQHPTNTPAVSSIYLLPKPQKELFRPRVPNRDESPPASPHFIPHTQQTTSTSPKTLLNILPVAFTRHTHTYPPGSPKLIPWPIEFTSQEYPTTTFKERSHIIAPPINFIRPNKEQSKLKAMIPARTTTSTSIKNIFLPNTKARIESTYSVRKKLIKPSRTSTLKIVEFLPVKDFAFQTSNEGEEEVKQATTADVEKRVPKGEKDKENDVYSIFDNDYDNYPIGEPKGGGGVGKNGNVEDEARNQRQIEEDISKMDKVMDLDQAYRDKVDNEYERNTIIDLKTTQSDPELEEDLIFKTTKNRSIVTQTTVHTTIMTTELFDEPATLTTAKVNYKLEPNGSITIMQSLKLFKTVCSLIKLRALSFSRTITLPEIIDTLKHWAETSPLAQLVDITEGNYTTMENSIFMMMIDDPSHGQAISAKDTVMIIAGIQGRDHHAVLSAMYVLYQLLEHSDSHSDILSRYRFWIIPVFNPDGYDYSMSFPTHRQWKKNLRQRWEYCDGKTDKKKLISCNLCETLGIRCFVQPCYGVNLDRNFEYQWIPPNELHTEYPCGDLYPGPHQLSEPETYALTNFLHQQPAKLHTFLAFKEGDVLGVMYPYSHTKKKRMFHHIYRQRATAASRAAFGVNGRQYVAGQTSEFLPLYAGGIEDWFDGHLGIDNTYAIVMSQPHYSKIKREGFLEGVTHEAFAAMDTLLLQKVSEPEAQPKTELTDKSRRNSALLYTQANLKLMYSAIFVAVLS